MTPKEKAQEIFDKMYNVSLTTNISIASAIVAVDKEYNSLREQLCNLRSCHVIENEKVYLARIDLLNQEESQIKTELEAL